MDTKKLKKLSITDFVKDNSAGVRLRSLHLPRDLSLGGTKQSKKSYKPNLNVTRNKDKAKVTIKKNDKSKERYNHFQEKQKDRFVQSSGVFSEGVGDSVKPIIETRVHVRERHETENPMPIRKETRKIENRVEDKLIEEIVKFEDVSDNDTDVKAPFKPTIWCTSKLSEDNVKYEETVLNFLPKEYEENSETSKSLLTLWQLPDSFAFKDTIDLKVKKSTDSKLSELPEGKIGKICIRKSGKTVVCIGSVQYELEPSEIKSFVEEVVSVNIAAQEPSAVVLGDVENRFLLNPVWSSLLLQ